jgi:hypothetical protein
VSTKNAIKHGPSHRTLFVECPVNIEDESLQTLVGCQHAFGGRSSISSVPRRKQSHPPIIRALVEPRINNLARKRLPADVARGTCRTTAFSILTRNSSELKWFLVRRPVINAHPSVLESEPGELAF